MARTIEVVGSSLEGALAKATKLLGHRPGGDFGISRVIDWGAQYGGITQTMTFWVKVEADETSPFKT